MRKLIIIGAGGHGKVIANAAEKMNAFNEISFLDDNKINESIIGFKVIDKTDNMNKYKETHEFIVGIGSNEVRLNLQSKLEREGYKITSVIHPSAIIEKEVKIGLGTVITAGVVINPNTEIGRGCIINTSSIVDHDCILENFVHLSPGVVLSGEVKVGNLTWLGAGVTSINNIEITSFVTIGAGSTIVGNIIHSGVYVGTPARKVS